MQPSARNPRLLCAYYGAHALLFPMAVFSLFWTRDIGMSVATMLTVQAFFGLVIALFEFPSGYVADRLGHRRAIVLGTAATVVGWAIYALAHGLGTVLLAEATLGLGYALISGADSALLYESLRELGREQEFARWFGFMRTIAQVAEGLSALLAGYLYARWARLPFALEVVVALLALTLALSLAASRRAAVTAGHLGRMRALVRRVLREDTALRATQLVMIAFALATFAPIWLMALYATDAGLDVAWVGPMWAVGSFTTAIGAALSERSAARLGHLTLLWSCVGLIALGYLGLGLAQAAWGVAFYFLLTFVRGLHLPLLHHGEQRLAPADDRAGAVSLRSFLFRGSFVLLGPLIGVAVDQHGQRPVLLVCGGLSTLLLSSVLVHFQRQVQ